MKKGNHLAGTTIQKLVDLIEKSLLDLESSSSQDFIESTAILIHEAMSGPHRRFHTTDHVFQVIDPQGNPVLVLAALFHDLVYYNVDGGLTAQIEELVRPYITIELEQVFIRRRGPSQDPLLPMLVNIFGFSYGQLLTPYTGLNEFLSAVVFARLFHPLLKTKDLVGVLACLEASQPFRRPDENGKSCFALLEERLQKLDRTRAVGLLEGGVIEVVNRALQFANLDVSNFACEDSAVFLDNTWKLLPENNPHLTLNKVYTIKSYRAALEKMEIFFNRVDVSVIFHRYRNEPALEVYDGLQAQAIRNVLLAKAYLSGRLLATGILEALCQVTGGDAPVVMIMGNNSRGNVETKYEFNDLINRISVKMAKDTDPQVLALLEYEADLVSILDFRKTPLGAFVYKSVGHAKMLEYLQVAKEYFSGRMTAERFLESIDSYVVSSIAGVCAEMISTRRNRFISWTKPRAKKRSA
jgi:hypothetical protein